MFLLKQERTGATSSCRRCQKKKENKKPDKYKHEWMLNPRCWSICYMENHGFFCVLCKKHKMTNAQNKSQTFIETPSKRLKEDSLKTHMASTVHSSAIQADLLQRMSVFHQNYVEKLSSDNCSSECVCHCVLSNERIRCKSETYPPN